VEEALRKLRLESPFFPHPAEIGLRIKQLQEEREAERKKYRLALAAQKQVEREREHARALAAGEYTDLNEIMEDFYRKNDQVPAEELPPAEDSATAMDRMMAAFAKGMAAGEEYEPHVVEQVKDWQERSLHVRR
jgi:hypothetical protein